MFTSQRHVDLRTALRDMDAERVRRADVREAPCNHPGVTAWRGKSGRRYVASIRALDAAITTPAVLIAVHRDGADHATLVAVASVRSNDALAGFLGLARAAGATELHAHTLAVGATERAEVVRDLSPAAAYRPAADRAALATDAGFDRRAIMATAIGLARIAHSLTGQPWSVCMGQALRAAWAAARRARLARAH